MGKFKHTPNDTIYINNTSFPLSFFLTVEPAYALPAGMITQYYEQTVIHNISDGVTGYNLTIPWTDGDGYIANEAVYIAAYASYLNSLITLSQAKTTRIGQMLEYASGIKVGHVIVNTEEYFSDSIFSSKLVNEDLSYTRVGLPVGYYVNDKDYVQIPIGTLGDLEDIIDRIVELHYLTDINADVHRAAINALLTVTDVQNYDFITGGGWQTVPY
jgi:hypothetical protein